MKLKSAHEIASHELARIEAPLFARSRVERDFDDLCTFDLRSLEAAVGDDSLTPFEPRHSARALERVQDMLEACELFLLVDAPFAPLFEWRGDSDPRGGRWEIRAALSTRQQWGAEVGLSRALAQFAPSVSKEGEGDSDEDESEGEDVCEPEPEPTPEPGRLTVRVADADGKGIEGADVSLDGTNKGKTDPRGNIDLGEMPDGPYEVTASKKAFATVTVTAQVSAATTTLAQVSLGACQITKVEPTAGTKSAPTKWMVNLNASAPDKYGREIEVAAHITPAQAGVTIKFEIEEDAGNYDKTKLSSGDRGSVVTASADTDSAGIAKSKLKLSLAGLDKFRVVANIDGFTDKRESGWHQVWRKLYYQQTRMKTTYSFPFTNVEGEYAKFGLELASSGAVVEGTHRQNLETKDLKAYATTWHKTRKPPFEAHILLIDRQCDSKLEALAADQTVVSKQYTFTTTVWPFSDWKVEAKWRKKGTTLWADIPAVTKAGSKVTVDLSTTGVDPTADTVEIDLEVKLLKGEYTGDATYKPHMFIATGTPRSAASKSKTVNHEIGHGIGMVPTSGHDKQYANANGGLGSHCRSGATPDKKSLAQGGTFTGEFETGTCVMFASSSSHYSFCSVCKPHVSTAKVAEADMKARKWG